MGERKKVVMEFERPLLELYEKIEELKRLTESSDIDLKDEIKNMELRASALRKRIYANLTPYHTLQIARHQHRPKTLEIINKICTNFVELHGDRNFGDDPALVGGLAHFDGKSIMVLGHQKGEDTKDNIYRNFGMANPEGYRKALRLMKMAEKFNLPILALVDTPGAFAGITAEERGQAEAIARNLLEMSGLKVPIITIIVGEGGSGGALGIAVANRVLMMQHAVYSVISPEGCASILFRDSTQAQRATEALKITAKDLKGLGIIDDIIPEPPEGAHTNISKTCENISKAVAKQLTELLEMTPAELVEDRYQKFRKMGEFKG